MSIEDVKSFTENCGLFGEPLEWNGLKLHPILMTDRKDLERNIVVFDIDKNKIGDVQIIKMSYLMFLFGLIEIDASVRDAFLWIVNRVIGLEYNEDLRNSDFAPNDLLVRRDGDVAHYIINGWEIAFEVKGNIIQVYFGDIAVSSTMFEELRRIVLYQNLEGFDDTPISDDVKKVVEQYYALKNKGIKPPTLEDKMLAILTGSTETRETIKTMPCRQFDRLFHKIVDKVEYASTKPLLPHLKDQNIEHWIYKTEKDKWGEIFSSPDDVMKPTVT